MSRRSALYYWQITRQRVLLRVRVFQTSGISLLTLALLNGLFNRMIAWHVDFIILLAGVSLLGCSFMLWARLRRRKSQILRYA